MDRRLNWLLSCKLSQLRSLAVATGVNSSGSKPVLISGLTESLREERFPSRQHGFQVLSIDMGIRNLAYCRIQLPKPCLSSAKETPIIMDWNRFAVSSRLTDDPSTPPIKEAFDPATFSQHAYRLIQKLVLSPHTAPDHILIERQRFRSMGGSSVLEWTLRVNMFEAMLYATLKTLSEQRKWKGSVFPVLPSKVGQFWLESMEKAEKDKKGEKKDIKREKIQAVDKMLVTGGSFILDGSAKEMAESWREKVNGGRGRGPKEEEGEKMGKLDDLADCLLQGLAWVKWEENKRKILEHGMEALEELSAIQR